jgi:hypothetical protein
MPRRRRTFAAGISPPRLTHERPAHTRRLPPQRGPGPREREPTALSGRRSSAPGPTVGASPTESTIRADQAAVAAAHDDRRADAA